MSDQPTDDELLALLGEDEEEDAFVVVEGAAGTQYHLLNMEEGRWFDVKLCRGARAQPDSGSQFANGGAIPGCAPVILHCSQDLEFGISSPRYTGWHSSILLERVNLFKRVIPQRLIPRLRLGSALLRQEPAPWVLQPVAGQT